MLENAPEFRYERDGRRKLSTLTLLSATDYLSTSRFLAPHCSAYCVYPNLLICKMCKTVREAR